MKRVVYLTVIVLALLYCPSALAANVAREVAGWYNDGWNAESHAAYMGNAHVFSEVNPYWYDLGTPHYPTLADGSISERTYAVTAQNVVDAHANGDLVIPSMADHGTGQIDAIVTNPTARLTLVANIVATVLRRNYDGMDLNFESGTPAAREAFTAFVQELALELHKSGKRLEITIKAASTVTEENWYLFDYAGLGATAVDRLKIMAYDHNFDAGANVPGPIAPMPWLRSVLSYAVARGVPSRKIMLGLHNYGWTWKKVSGGWQFVPQFDTFQNVVQKSGNATFQWDAAALEAFKQYTYGGKTYRSYVGTSDVVLARVGLADEFDLAGVAFWVLGREDASTYGRVCTAFGASCTPPPAGPVLLSRGRATRASSSFDATYTSAKAVDGDLLVGWLANPAESSSWLDTDLGRASAITKVQILWGGYDWATSYDVQVSDDGLTFRTVYHEAANADGGLDTITLANVSGRFVRVVCNGPKSDGWSYEIYELSVFGTN